MMNAVAGIVLGVSLGIVVYSYAIYPVLLWLCARWFGRLAVPPVMADVDLPAVSLVIAAHNEERWIQARIENALALNYPADRLEIVVASDGSRDATVAIVQGFADRRVRVLDFSENKGKATALNQAVPAASGDIVVFSDANTFFEPQALRHLVRWFADPAIGAVCGRLVLTDPAKGQNVDSLYWKYETFLKTCESRLGALLGANGAIYALRRQEYVPIPGNTLVDDFVIPLIARLRNGKAIVYDHAAVAWEETPPAIRDEFRRRSRIGTGGFQALMWLWPLLSPRCGWVAFAFLSHKVLRWFCPHFLVLALVANLFLLDSGWGVSLLAGQVGFYLVAALGGALPGQGLVSRVMRLPAMFASMNLALLVGFWNWVFGTQKGVWQRTAR